MAIEVEKVLSDLYPLLRTVQPAQLNYTLTALADALEGRGEKLGNNLVVLDDYLKRMNPKIPLLVDDLGKLATVSDTYAEVAAGAGERAAQQRDDRGHVRGEGGEGPGVVRRRGRVLPTSQDFLEQNGVEHHPVEQAGSGPAAVVREVRTGVPLPRQGHRRGDPAARSRPSAATRCTSTSSRCREQPRGYNPGDSPVYAEHGEHAVPLGQCEKAIHGGYGQSNLPPNSLVPNVKDGVNYPLGKKRPATGFDVTSGYAGTASERDVVELASPAPPWACPPARCPTSRPCCSAPLARGTEVSVR